MLALAVGAAPLAAQTTREEGIAEQQRAKAAALHPDTEGPIEHIVVALRRAAIESPSGPYPILDGVYSGGGVSGGAGYKQFTGERAHLDLRVLASVKRYAGVEGTFQSPGHAGGRLDLEAGAAWMVAPQVGYFGLGQTTEEAARANFQMRRAIVSGTATVRPASHWVLGAGVASEAYTLDGGEGSSPSIEERYTAADAPGLGDSPTFTHLTASAAYDWRPAPGYARRGGSYGLSWHRYVDNDGQYGFSRVDVDLVQHVPILRENWVLSGRARLQGTVGDQDVVPFFLMPALGGGSTLRAYTSFRFRDRQAALVQGEFRWIPNRLGLDMALFVDAGTVAHTFDALTTRHVARDVGIGVRLHTPAATPIRVEFAKGREGYNIVFAAKAVF